MAGPCFWSEIRGLKQECGDPGPPETIDLIFENGYLRVDDRFVIGLDPRFVLGQDFSLDVEGDRSYLMRYSIDNNRYAIWEDGEEQSYSGPDGAPGTVVQGSKQWTVIVYSWWI